MSDEDPVRADDGLDFNDPSGWGFCDYCAFLVAVVGGLRIVHRRYRNGGDDSKCNGSGQVPVTPVPRRAKARQMVSLKKEPNRAKSRARWQRARWEARGKALKAKSMTLQPTRITVTSHATGEEIDITSAVTGPVVISMEADDGE